MTTTLHTDDTLEALSAALSELGDTPEQVAQSLRERGIKGRQREADACPVAAYLYKKFPTLYAHVDMGTVGLFESSIRYACLFSITTPAAVSAFIYAFDRNGFPYLIDEIGEEDEW